MFIPNNLTVSKLQTAEDLQGDALLHYDAGMELMNLILLSILNCIYNSVDACTSAKDMWKIVERLMRGTIQNKVDRETRFTNEFDQFVAELGDRVNIQSRNSGNTSTVQCYNCSGKRHYARNCPKPRVRDSIYFMEQMLLAKQDEAGVILTDEHNDFLFADATRMEEIKELSPNICLMARIQPADNTSDAGPSYDFVFISEVQSSSNNENDKH
ncbi:integrase, catalytic region, zinc finger, CCHC-type containing protein [Tanacetum coccineum]